MPSPAFVTPPNQMPSPNPPPQGGFPWKWVLLGCGGVIFLGIALIIALGVFAFKTGKQKYDEAKENYEKHVKVTTDSEGQPKFQIKNLGDKQDGTLTIGGAKVPEWMPAYPGVEIKNSGNVRTDKETMDTYTFTTSDTPDAVAKFYDEKLKADGFTNIVNHGTQNAQSTALVIATKKSEGYMVQVTSVNKGKDGDTVVSVMATMKAVKTPATATPVEKEE